MKKASITGSQLHGLSLSDEFGFGIRNVSVSLEKFTHPVRVGDRVALVPEAGGTLLHGRVTRIVAEVEVE